MEPLLSIIVPVYKVEPYLRKCVDSIIAQTYTNLEIILVDDGSPDNCGKICDEYAKLDNRIKVIHKANGGLSSARNAGLDIANGDYIGFVDSDDYILPQMYERLYCLMTEHSVDIAECDFTNGSGDKAAGELSVIQECSNTDEMLEAVFIENAHWAVWCKLYRAELWHDIRMMEGVYFEDAIVFFDIAKLCPKSVVISEKLYWYNTSNISITRTQATPKHLSSNLIYLSRLDEYLSKADKVTDAGAMFMCSTIIVAVWKDRTNSSVNKTEIKTYKGKLHKLLVKYWSVAIKTEKYRQLGFFHRVEWRVFRYAPILYDILHRVFRAAKNVTNRCRITNMDH